LEEIVFADGELLVVGGVVGVDSPSSRDGTRLEIDEE